MHDLYDKEYLKLTLNLLADDINDLGTWSVYNGDKGFDEIYALREAFNKVQKALEGGETK